MSQLFAKYIQEPKYIALFIGVVVLFGVLVWFIRRISRPPVPPEKPSIFSGPKEPVKGAAATRAVQDVGRDTVKLTSNGQLTPIPVGMNLPKADFWPRPNDGALGSPHAVTPEQASFFGTTDLNVDPKVQAQWAKLEIPFQTNTTPERSGQVWVQNSESWGPIAPFAPQGTSLGAPQAAIGGPTDPQLAYATAITAAMDAQAEKFCIREDPSDEIHQYRAQLQQLPGSHFPVFAASFDAYDSPQVVDRFALLPEMAAKWVIANMNVEMQKDHPCFSLSGREHFESENPNFSCGDTSNPKNTPINLIRIFDCRIKRNRVDESQDIYLTMEIGNQISGGSGGMFSTVVTADNKGKFVNYTTPQRDEKNTFVFIRSR